MVMDRTSLGCWIVKGNASTVWDYFGEVTASGGGPDPHIVRTSWSLSVKSNRADLVRKGDLIALWITGDKRPGIHEFGYVTSEGAKEWPHGFDDELAIDQNKAAEPAKGVEYTAVRLLDAYVPREEVKASPALRECEQLRAPLISNPSFLTPHEARALQDILVSRVRKRLLTQSGWHAL